MGIRFYCPNGHKLNVKSFQAGRRGICPYCGAKIIIPTQSTRKSSKAERAAGGTSAQADVEQEVVLHPDSSGKAAPNAQPIDAAPGTGGPYPMAARPDAPAGGPVQAGTIPTATPLGFPGSASESAPQRPTDGGARPAARVDSLPAAGMQILPVAPAQAEPALQSDVQAPSPSQAPPPAPPRDEASDPLAEAGNVVWYVRPPSGGQFGPATGDVMRTWISEGRVSADSLVWREGWRDWQEAGKVFAQMGAEKDEFGVDLGPSESAAEAVLGKMRSRRRQAIKQVTVITSLILAVLVLVVAFVWVLFYYSPQ